MLNEDFSYKWFGVPDAQVVAFWDKLDRMPRGVPHNANDKNCCCTCCRQQSIADYENKTGRKFQ